MRTRAWWTVGVALAAVVGVVACVPEPPPSTTTTTSTSTTSTSTTTTTTIPITTTDVLFECTNQPLSLSFAAQAPATVPQLLPYQTNLSLAPTELPTSSVLPIASYEDIRLRIPIPAGTPIAGPPTLSGGSNLGDGVPSIAVTPDGEIEVLIPGPLTAGETVTFPTFTLPLLAVGPVGSSVDLKLAGDSLANPSLTFTAQVEVSPGNLFPFAQSCFETNGGSVLSTTTITSALFPT